MKGVLKKKPVLICALTVLLLLLSFLSLYLSNNATISVSASQHEFVLDADQLSFEGKTETAQKDVNDFLQKGTDNDILQTSLTKANPTVKLNASLYGDKIYGGENDAVRIEVRLLFNRWPDRGYGGFSEDATFVALEVYNSADVGFENPLITMDEYGAGKNYGANYVRTFQLLPQQICNNRGKLQNIVLRAKSDASSWTSTIIVDYVKIVFNTNGIFEAGDCVVGRNPENISDDNVLWTEAKGNGTAYIDGANYGGQLGYVDNPAVVDLREERFPDVECVTESDGTETLLLKNAVFALNVGNIVAENYKQFLMDILLSDKRVKGGHTLYLYGSCPDNFVDEKGNPVGYVSKVSVESYEQGFHNKFALEAEELQKLAGDDGIISNIYVLYHGNTLDTTEETVGLRNGSQIWINKIQFLSESEIETPIVRVVEGKYDISDVFPIGEGVRIENKAVAKPGDIVSNATLENKKVEELSFQLTMESGDNIAFLFNAKERKQCNEYADGGILFSLSDSKIEISAHMEGAKTKAFAMTPEFTFSNKTAVKLVCIPYYLNSVEGGYYCAIFVGDKKLVDGYFGNDDLALGNAFHLCYQVKDNDFSVSIASSKTEGITSAKDLMNVKIKTEKIHYSLDKTDIPLALSWYDTGFDAMSEVKCDGGIASINQDTNRIQFNENGEAKVVFSITNAFGTFESNELSIVCEDVIDEVEPMPETVRFYERAWFITLYFLPFVGFGVVGVILIIKKVKMAKKDK